MWCTRCRPYAYLSSHSLKLCVVFAELGRDEAAAAFQLCGESGCPPQLLQLPQTHSGHYMQTQGGVLAVHIKAMRLLRKQRERRAAQSSRGSDGDGQPAAAPDLQQLLPELQSRPPQPRQAQLHQQQPSRHQQMLPPPPHDLRPPLPPGPPPPPPHQDAHSDVPLPPPLTSQQQQQQQHRVLSPPPARRRGGAPTPPDLYLCYVADGGLSNQMYSHISALAAAIAIGAKGLVRMSVTFTALFLISSSEWLSREYLGSGGRHCHWRQRPGEQTCSSSCWL